MPHFPTINTIAAWKRDLAYALQYASCCTDNSEVAWLSSMWAPNQTYAELRSGGMPLEFKTLDQKLANALRTSITTHGPYKLRLALDDLGESAIREGSLVSGLQHGWCILNYFRTHDSLDNVCTVVDLVNLPYNGDAKMHIFRSEWHRAVSNLRSAMDAIEHRDILYRKIQHSTALKSDVAEFERMAPADPRKTLEFLLDCVGRYIERDVKETSFNLKHPQASWQMCSR